MVREQIIASNKEHFSCFSKFSIQALANSVLPGRHRSSSSSRTTGEKDLSCFLCAHFYAAPDQAKPLFPPSIPLFSLTFLKRLLFPRSRSPFTISPSSFLPLPQCPPSPPPPLAPCQTDPPYSKRGNEKPEQQSRSNGETVPLFLPPPPVCVL